MKQKMILNKLIVIISSLTFSFNMIIRSFFLDYIIYGSILDLSFTISFSLLLYSTCIFIFSVNKVKLNKLLFLYTLLYIILSYSLILLDIPIIIYIFISTCLSLFIAIISKYKIVHFTSSLFIASGTYAFILLVTNFIYLKPII